MYRATNTCLNMTVCMTFHVPEWAMHPARLDGLNLNVKCIQKYPLEMHIRNGRTLTNVDIANLRRKQHCPYHVHYAINNSAEHYQKNPWPERGWQAAGHDLEDVHVDLLCHKHTSSRNSAARVSNSSKQKHTVPYHVVARQRFAIVGIANGSLRRSEVRRSRKSVICRLPLSALKHTKECNPLNAVQYCGEIVSIFLIIRELER